MAGTSGYLATKSWNPFSAANKKKLFDAKEKDELLRARELKRALELKQERKEEAEARLVAVARASGSSINSSVGGANSGAEY